MNSGENKDADDDIETWVGKRQPTSLIRYITDERVAPRCIVVAMFLRIT